MAASPLHQVLADRVAKSPRREAIVCGDQRLSWSQMYGQIQQRVPQLESVETPLAILACPEPATVAWVWAAILAQHSFSMLDPSSPAARQSRQLEHLGAAHVAEPGELRPLRTACPRSVDPKIASILYTSASRGEAKGVAMTADAMAASVDSILDYLPLRTSDRIWAGLPLHYGYGLYQIFLSAASGATLVLPQYSSLVGETLRLLTDQRVSILPGVPTLFDQLLEAESFSYERLPSLRLLTNAGEHLPTPTIRGLRERFPQLQMHAMYGLTEYTRVSALAPDEIDDCPTSVGRPIQGCRTRIVDAAGYEVAPGSIGELVVQGVHLMASYWQDREATERCLRPLPDGDGLWLHTGDLFEQDQQGRLYHRGRQDDVFKCRGQKVSPARVSEVLESHPSIARALVVPLRSGRRLEVVALLRTTCPIDPSALRHHCRRSLAAHEVPTRFEAVEEFPRNARGKLDRRAAMRLVASPEGES